MADSKISALPTITTVNGDELIPVCDDPSGTPATKAITAANLGRGVAGVAVAVYKTSTNQSIPNATVTKVSFNAETFDTNGMHDNSTNNTRLTVPTGLGGIWLVRGAGAWAANSSGIRELFWKINDTTYPPGSNRNANLGSDAVYMAAPTLILQLAAGDYVEMMAYQNSGGSLDLAVGDTTASMVRLGA